MRQVAFQPGVFVSKLIEPNGMYNFRSYYGKKKADGSKPIFTLIGTRMPQKNSAVKSCIDTFASESGKVVEMTREEVIGYVGKGMLLPVLSSVIQAKGEITEKKVTKKK